MDPRYLELMNNEIDGVNSEAESAELEERLASDPGAREQFRQLSALSQTLADLPSEQPPTDLKDAVLAALPASRPFRAQSGPSQWFRSILGSSPRRRIVLSYGYAAAAGLIVGVVVSHWAPLAGSPGRGLEPSDLVGTLTSRQTSPAILPPIREISLNSQGVKGMATLRRGEAGFVIELDIDPQAPLDVVLSYDSKKAGFRGFAQDLDSVRNLAIDGRTIRWSQDGHRRLALVLTPRMGAESTVKLGYFVSGRPVGGAELNLPNS
jgi:hypothetical protein